MSSNKFNQNQSSIYPAIYVIFTLLNAVRRGVECKNIWREFRRQKVALKPRLRFWVALCKEAGLLSGNQTLAVTRYARSWLNKTPEEQTFLLIEAWRDAPKNIKARQFRKKLLWKLKHDKPFTQKDLGALNGLEALGINSERQLTLWGEFFIKGEGKLPTPKPTEPCRIEGDHFIASLPHHIDLLWEIETHLRPASPGKYPLNKRNLHGGDIHRLIELIEKGLPRTSLLPGTVERAGLQGSIPESAKAMLLNQPSIRIREGIVLEFSSPAELAQLRRQPALRKYFDEFLSPQRVLVSSQQAKLLFEMLKRRGVYVHRNPAEMRRGNEAQAPASPKRTHFLQKTLPQPVGRNVSDKLLIIEKYKQLGQALDVLYRAPGYPTEQRRITPLSIEQHGEQTYIIAYCQTRRAQRTFRLDRMEVPGTY